MKNIIVEILLTFRSFGHWLDDRGWIPNSIFWYFNDWLNQTINRLERE